MLVLETQVAKIAKPIFAVAPIAAKVSTMPIFTHILFTRQDNLLSIRAGDGENQITLKIDASDMPGENASFAVSAKKVVDILKSLPDNAPLILRCEENGTITLRSGRSRFTLQTLPAEEYPAIAPDESKKTGHFSIAQGELRKHIARVIYAASDSDVRYYLKGVYLDSASGFVRVTATNSHHLASSKSSAVAEGTIDAIMSRKSAQDLLRLLDPGAQEEVRVECFSAMIRLCFANTELVCKLIDGRYPSVDRVLPNPKVEDGYRRLVVRKKDLEDAIKRISIVADDMGKNIRPTVFDVGQTELVLKGSNEQQENAHEILDVTNFEGKPIIVGYNASYLAEMLSAVGGESVELHLIEDRAASIKIDNDDSFAYVLMPMRL